MSTKLNWPQRKIMAVVRRADREGRQVTIKKDLMPALRCSNYQVRLLIQQMQDIGAPICTTAHGVMLATSAGQLEEQFERMREHGISTLVRAYQLKGCRLSERMKQQLHLNITQTFATGRDGHA
jgi:hypothetical protein